VPTIVPEELVVRRAEGIWKSVVLPMLETLKSVEVAALVEEPMAKSVVAVSPLLVWMENLAQGDVEPMEKEPEVGSARMLLLVVAG
jgi:hypothetical protein